MRYSIFLFLSLFLLFSCQPTKAQTLNWECGTPEVQEDPSGSFHYTGEYITSTGTLKVLVIFIRFADDNDSSGIWPNPTILPIWGSLFCQ